MAEVLAQHGREIEWQFDALDLRPVERFIEQAQRRVGDHSLPQVVSKGARRLTDVYFDTSDWRVARAGCVVRVRKAGRRFSATMKDLVEGSDGLRKRLELTEPVSGPTLPHEALGPVSSRILALTGSHLPRAILEVRTRRRPFALLLEGVEVGELALDETSVVVPGMRTPLRLRRVEVEVQSGSLHALGQFVTDLRTQCRLQPASLSKFEAGLLAAGTPIPGPPHLGSTEVDEHSSVAEVAFAVLRRDAAAVFSREPGTRLGEDAEELHQMRVATRRMRAALAMFLDVLPVRAAHLLDEVGWLARELGNVRDLDVQLDQIARWQQETAPDERAGLVELASTLARLRAAARDELLAALDSRRYERLVVALTQMLSQSAPRRTPGSRTRCVVALPELIDERQRVARKAARRARRSGLAPDFHRLRIRCKRLRYALEFSEDCYRGATKRFAKVLSSLQDELGEMQDAEVAATRLRNLALSGTGELSLEAVFAIGGIAERYRRESERLLRRLAREVQLVDGAEWKRLEATLERRREAALAATVSPRSVLQPKPVTAAETQGQEKPSPPALLGPEPALHLEVVPGSSSQ